ncbi:MAG: coproporphyrinogen oxidase [Paenibacillaceae bacterium]|nr:coproporphyrinogen oxidase [Paenibacillaceae bacterium]
MNIAVDCRGCEDAASDIFHICRLFYEDAKAVRDPQTEADMSLRLEVETHPAKPAQSAPSSAVVHARAELRNLATGEAWESSHTVESPANASPQDIKRTTKRCLNTALLQTLTQATGLTQPWGILTGVRPTKLAHQLLLNGGRTHAISTLREQYRLSPEKSELITDIAARQLAVIPDLYRLDREVSIYIGIPFCPTKCAYCTFPAYDIRGNNGSVDAFLAGLHEEIRTVGAWLHRKGLKITTIYWGGGTPTSIEAEQIDDLFRTLHASFPHMDSVRELTVEAGRPDTIDEAKIEVLKRWNVDRISINPQSFTQSTLDTIGRDHTVEDAVEKFKLARRLGLNNINMDLIIGLPDEGVEQFRHTLAETAKLLPESLTVHTLAFKRASRMTRNKESFQVAERDEVGEMMQMATDWTHDHGYAPYYLYRQKNILGNLENVGYSLAGRESLYNIVMMEERQTVIGLGCGAVSKVLFPTQSSGDDDDENGREAQRIERFPNPKEPSVYNSSHRDYVDRKLKLLEEAYPDKTQVEVAHG